MLADSFKYTIIRKKCVKELIRNRFLSGKFRWCFTYKKYIMHTAVSKKVVQLKSIKAYATIPKGMMGCGCSLLHRQVHEFSARWKRCYEYLFACVKRNKMDSELLLTFNEYFPDCLLALSCMFLDFSWTTFVETAVYKYLFSSMVQYFFVF